MGTLTDVYANLVDDLFHRRRFDRLALYLADDYQVVDAYRPGRGGGVDGMRAHGMRALTGYHDVRYDIVDSVEVGDRLATRYVVVARDSKGGRVAASGLSLHHGRDGRLARSWHVGDQRDLGVYDEDELAPELLDRWMTSAPVDVGPLGGRHRTLVDRLYVQHAPVDDLVTADHLAYDPFADRLGIAGTVAINRALRAALTDVRFHILDAFEDGSRLATRFALRGRREGREVTVPGVSINEVKDGRLSRAWIYARYGRLAPLVRAAATEAALAAAEGAP
jgi:predicted ester cyclase